MHQEENRYRIELTILLKLFREQCENFITDMMHSSTKEAKIELLENQIDKTNKYIERFVFLSNQLDVSDPLREKMLDSIPFVDLENDEIKGILEKYRNLPPDVDPLDYP